MILYLKLCNRNFLICLLYLYIDVQTVEEKYNRSYKVSFQSALETLVFFSFLLEKEEKKNIRTSQTFVLI